MVIEESSADRWIRDSMESAGTEVSLMTYYRDDGTPYERGPLEGPKPGTQEHEALARLLDGEHERRKREVFGDREDSIATQGAPRRTGPGYRPTLSPKLAFFGGLVGALLGLVAVGGSGSADFADFVGAMAALGFVGALAGWILLEVLKWAFVIVVGGVALVALLALAREVL
jgi:hypothetical protein